MSVRRAGVFLCALAVLAFAPARPARAFDLLRGVVVGAGAAVRTAPSEEAPVLREVAEGQAVLVLDRSSTPSWLGPEKDYWYRVETARGDTGWLHGSQLLTSALEGHVSGRGVRLRDAPGVEGMFVRSLGPGQWVTVLERTEAPETIGDETARWYRVRTRTTEGWVFGAYLELALATPRSAHAPFLGMYCWPGLPDEPHPDAAQILAGLDRWRKAVAADVAVRLAAVSEDANEAQRAASATLADAWQALGEGGPADAAAAVAPLTELAEDVATPLGSARAAAAVIRLRALIEADAADADIAQAAATALRVGNGVILTGTDWAAPADLAAFDRYTFYLERERQDPARTREWAEQVALDSAQSAPVRGAAGLTQVRLAFAARRPQEATIAARGVFGLGSGAQVACGPAPVHFGVATLARAVDELTKTGAADDALRMTASLREIADATLQAAARALHARLLDLGDGDLDAVLAAYEAVPAFTVRLADLTTLDDARARHRAQTLRALADRVGASDTAWVTGDRVRVRTLPSTAGNVLRALPRDAQVRVLYPLPEWAAQDDVPWVKVRMRGGPVGWMSAEYLQLQPSATPAMPQVAGMAWAQPGGAADGHPVARGREIDAPVVVWRVPEVPTGGPAIGDVNGDGIADLLVTGVFGTDRCRSGVAALDGRTQGVLWQTATAGCTGADPVTAAEGLVLVVSNGDRLEAFDTRTGAHRWTWTPAGGTVTAAVAADGRAAVGLSTGEVAVLNLRTGDDAFALRVGEPVPVPPAIAGDMLYAVSAGYVTAFDLARQRPAWRLPFVGTQRPASEPAAPAGGVAVHDNHVLAVSPQGVLLVADRRAGKTLWQTDAGGVPAPGAPISDGTRVMVALREGSVAAWTLADATPAWRASARGPIGTGMLLADHTLVVGTTDGWLLGLGRVDGRLRWELALDAPLDRGPAGAAQRVVVASSAGPLFVVTDEAVTKTPRATPFGSGPGGGDR